MEYTSIPPKKKKYKGQILSSRPDLLPEAYLKALSRLQDKVKPFPFEEVEQTIVQELGLKLSPDGTAEPRGAYWISFDCAYGEGQNLYIAGK